MKVIGAVINGQAVVLAIHYKMSLGDSVSIAADQSAKERFGTVNHVLNRVMSLNNIGHLAFLVGNHDGHYCTTVIRDAYFHSITVRQRVEVGLFTLNDSLEVFSLQSGNEYVVHRRIDILLFDNLQLTIYLP